MMQSRDMMLSARKKGAIEIRVINTRNKNKEGALTIYNPHHLSAGMHR
jgi:hypothetical protein